MPAPSTPVISQDHTSRTGLGGGGFIVSEGNGTLSRHQGTLNTGSGTWLAAGRVMARINTTDLWSVWDPGGAGGLEIARGILLQRSFQPASGTVPTVILARLAEVNEGDLDWGAASAPQIVVAKAELWANSMIRALRAE